MKKKFILSLLFLGWMASLAAWDDSPRCMYSLETQFFDAKTVKESFDLYHVMQSLWGPAYTDLLVNVKKVPTLVKAKARKMSPNPFDNPFDPEKAKQVLIDAEFEVFRDTMVSHYFADLNAIHGMFDYIVRQQEANINRCLGVKKKVENKNWGGSIKSH
jgi:hypothetical protein